MTIPRISGYSLTQVNRSIENKTQWRVDPARAVLLIHDMQKYFVDFYDASEDPIKSVIENIKRLKIQCKRMGIPVVYTAQPPKQTSKDRALLSDFWGEGLAGDSGEEGIIQTLDPDQGDTCLTKWRYSAFQRTPLQSLMNEENKDQLIVCGVYTHIGILATALEAFMKDIKAFVVCDAVADFSLDEHIMGLNYIAQRCGQVVTLKEIENVEAQNSNRGTLSGKSLTLQSIKVDVAKILMLSEDEIGENDSLIELGLDSIRMMSLLDKWRLMGAEVTFTDLAEFATVSEWWRLIGKGEGTEVLEMNVSEHENE